MEEDIFSKGEFVFYYTSKEYNYVEDAIKLISNNIDSGLMEIEKRIEKEIIQEYEQNSYGIEFEAFKKIYNSEMDEIRFVSSSINESFIIKIYSIFEKALINFSYQVQTLYNCKIPPNFNLKTKYNDIEVALKYIEILSSINIKNVCNLNFINSIKQLRNKLSHGNPLMEYKKQSFIETNILVEILSIVSEKGNDLTCRVNNDPQLLTLILKEFKKIISVLNELNFDMLRCLGNEKETTMIKQYNEYDPRSARKANILGL